MNTLYPQNGERIVTIDFVTAFHLMHKVAVGCVMTLTFSCLASSGVAKNVNWGASPPLHPPSPPLSLSPPLPLLTGVRRYNPRNFF